MRGRKHSCACTVYTGVRKKDVIARRDATYARDTVLFHLALTADSLLFNLNVFSSIPTTRTVRRSLPRKSRAKEGDRLKRERKNRSLEQKGAAETPLEPYREPSLSFHPYEALYVADN